MQILLQQACKYFRSDVRKNCNCWHAWFLGTGKYHKGTPGNNECFGGDDDSDDDDGDGDDNDDDEDEDDDDDNVLCNVYSLVSAMQTVQGKV